MSVRPRCDAASRCMDCKAVASRSRRKRCCGRGCHYSRTRPAKGDLLCEYAPSVWGKGVTCAVQCLNCSLRIDDVDVCIEHVSRGDYNSHIHRYECVAIDTYREQVTEKDTTVSQQDATSAIAATVASLDMRYCGGHTPYFDTSTRVRPVKRYLRVVSAIKLSVRQCLMHMYTTSASAEDRPSNYFRTSEVRVIPDQITLHLFQPNQADQMLDPQT